jgi:hypothetical protein
MRCFVVIMNGGAKYSVPRWRIREVKRISCEIAAALACARDPAEILLMRVPEGGLSTALTEEGALS